MEFDVTYWIVAFWFGMFLLISILIFKTDKNWVKFLAVAIIMVSFLAFGVKDRMDLFTPIYHKPPSNIAFDYQSHTVKYNFDNKSFDVVVWLTRSDDHKDFLYAFPLEKNEKERRELDKLREMLKENKINGPFIFGGEGFPTEDEEQVAGFDTIRKKRIKGPETKEVNDAVPETR